jgi:plasmid maintenance system antidote protein VapI
VSLLWATLVALAVLERVFGDKRDEWRLLAQKATLWVKRSTANEPSTLSELTALSLAMDLPSDLTSLNN